MKEIASYYHSPSWRGVSIVHHYYYYRLLTNFTKLSCQFFINESLF